ncbi:MULTISPECIES: hypothetical protein [Micrococcaceae]|uniref:hypothetical protein n=1 Tax=Micrococcaceae TaxID=1268 RepID=UPI002E0C2197|nr:hypothetical protein [Arthrobacter sp. PL16]
MPSRTSQKSEARNLLEAERARQAKAHRRRNLMLGAAGLVVAGALAAGITVAANSHTSAQTATSAQGPAVSNAALPGLQTSPAPWQPEYANLPARLANLNLSPNGDESFHIHAHLVIYIDGKPVPVPANSGISIADQLESPMHTHDTTGVIHIEASQPSDTFTLGAFFDIWGVKLTATQIGGYTTQGDQTLQAYVNGQPVADPAGYVLKPHDDIVIGYGSSSSFPHTTNFTWPQNE